MIQGRGDIGGLMVVIDYPTINEAKTDNVMYGLPKRIIDTLIRKYWHGPIWWTCAYKEGYSQYQEYSNDGTPLPKITLSKYYKFYHDELVEEINFVAPTKLLVLGGTATKILFYPEARKSSRYEHGKAFCYQNIHGVTTYNPYEVIKDTGLYRDLEYGVNKLFTTSKPVEHIAPDMLLARSYGTLINSLNTIAGDKTLSCDIETTGLKFMQHTIDSIAFGSRDNKNVVIPAFVLDIPTCKEIVRKFFQRKDLLLVFHNAKFDVQFIEYYLGEKLICNIADTMLMHYTLDERSGSTDDSSSSSVGYSVHGLKELSRVYFDADDYKFDFKSFWKKEDKTLEDYMPLYMYQCYDTQYTIRLFDILKDKLKSDGMLKVCTNLLFPASRAYTDIEATGIRLDRTYFELLAQDYDKKVQDMLYPIWTKSGKLHLNPLAPKQVNEWLKEIGIEPNARRVSMKGENNIGTARGDLEQYAKILEYKGFTNYAEAIQLVIQARKYNKLNGTYFNGILKHLDPDNRIRTSIKLHGTSTGRISSAKPNMQNIPTREGKLVKNGFISDEDCTLLQFDYKQLELRIAAYLSQDTDMARPFNTGIDLHKVVAAAMFNKAVQDVTDFERFLAKAVDFGTLYGRSASALVDGAEMDYYCQTGGTRPSVQDMQDFIDNFLNGFPKLREWIAYTEKYVLAKKEVSTIFGRKRRFPFINNDRKLLGEIKRAGVNMPIQSAASDLCMSALIKLHNTLDPKCKILMSVHDSILLQVPDDMVTSVVPYIKDTMENGIIKTDFIKFEVDAEAGKSWGTMEKLKI